MKNLLKKTSEIKDADASQADLAAHSVVDNVGEECESQCNCTILENASEDIQLEAAAEDKKAKAKRSLRFTAADICKCAMFCALIAAGAFIKIPIPYMPFTMQTFFTMLAALLLPAPLALLSVGCYIGLGLVGVPIFTAGGGFSYVLQPTFGYLIGFLIGTPVSALIAKRKNTFSNYLLACLASVAIYTVIGLLYYYLISRFYIGTNVGAKILLVNCFLLTVPGDVLKMLLACYAGKRLRPYVMKYGWSGSKK